MKKLLILFVLLISVCVMTAALPAAAMEDVSYQADGESLSDYVDTEELEDYLRSSMLNFETTVNLEKFKIPMSAVQIFFEFFDDEFTDCFHAFLTRAWGNLEGNIETVSLEYNMEREDYERARVIWYETVDMIMEGLIGNDKLTDVQKALIIHDRMIVHCEYDYDRYLSGKVPEESYREYGVLVSGKAVCRGYAETYTYLLDMVGIESYICSSSKLNHAWNVVYIDGDYFYVDTTWDDPVWDVSGRVTHDNFLCSFEDFRKSHDADDYDQTPKNTKYDDYFWENSQSAFNLVGDQIYYIDENSSEIKTYGGKAVLNVYDKWPAHSGYSWVGNFARLDSLGTKLYYSLRNAIYSYDTENGKKETVFTPNHSFGKTYSIFGFKLDGRKLICEFSDTPSFGEKTKSSYTVIGELEALETFTVSYDANGGKGAPASQEKTEGVNIKLSDTVPVLTGYKFMGWSTKADGKAEYAPGDLFGEDKNITLFAVWKKLEISVSNAGGAAGKTVKVNISLVSNPGIAELILDIGFDGSVLTYEGYESMSPWNFEHNPGENSVNFSWENNKDIGSEGVALALIFRINEDAPNGSYPLDITLEKAVSADMDEPLEAELSKGSVTVRDCIVGDMSGDGNINASDAVILAQYLAKWKIELDKTAADCNADGFIDARDAVILAQYLAKWNITLG